MRNFLHRFFIIALLISPLLFAQKEIERNIHSAQNDQSQVRSLVIDANRIRTIVYNTGSVSNPGVQGNVLDMVWGGLGYAYEMGFLTGAKVIAESPAGDTIKFIVDGFGAASRSTADGDFSPDAITKWGWLPTSRYTKEGNTAIANNQDPSSWPADWSGWNGKYGAPIADMELLYEMDDSTDAEFNYLPIPSRPARKGLGLRTTARYYQFAHPNLENVLFTFFEVQNVSEKTLSGMVAGISGDPHIGGVNNFIDDTQDFDSVRQLMYSWDPDGLGDIPSLTPGYFGYTYVTTPESKGVTSYAALPWGGNNRAKNDALMYNTLSEGSKLTDMFYSKNPNNLGDYILLMGSGFFSLEPTKKAELGVAYMFAQDLSGIIEQAVITGQEYRIRFTEQGNALVLTSPVPSQIIGTSSVNIQWTDSALDNDTTINLYYSNSIEERWVPIATHVPNNGSFQWETSSLPDGIFYKVHILKEKNGATSYDSTGDYFTINRPGDAPPQIALLQPKNIKLVQGTIPVQWRAGDAENDGISVKIFLSSDNGFTYTLVKQVSNSGLYLFDTRSVPNMHMARLKLEASANGKEASAESKTFRISNYYPAMTDTASMKHPSGTATGTVFPGIADSAKITGDTYRITFDSSAGWLRYSLKNLTKNSAVLTSEPMTANNGSGTVADGMRIWFSNTPLGVDTARSKFTVPPANIRKTVLPTFSSMTKKPMPIDIAIQFGSMDTNATGAYLFPLDSLTPVSGTIPVKVPFSIVNLTDSTKFTARILEKGTQSNILRKTGRWDYGETIIIITPPLTTTIHASIDIVKNDYTKPEGLKAGDVLKIVTNRPFTNADVYEFVADVKYGKPTAVPGGAIPTAFALEQNFPNPFNPETVIRFSLAQPGRTSVKIYDVVGREVRVLADEEMKEGIYTIEWNGENQFGQPAASGVYLYRLQSGNFSSTKKMVLMR
jgi:hypothetical protein